MSLGIRRVSFLVTFMSLTVLLLHWLTGLNSVGASGPVSTVDLPVLRAATYEVVKSFSLDETDFTSLSRATQVVDHPNRPDLESLDASFVSDFTDAATRTEALGIQIDGKILVGAFGLYNGVARGQGIVRLNQDGSVDTGFAQPAVGNLFAIRGLPNGQILVGGTGGTIMPGNIRRLNADGSIDASFVIGSGANGNIEDIAVQTDGKILISGNFTQYNGTARTRIARLNTDGSLDTSFVPPTVAITIRGIAIQSDGKIVGAGNFSEFGVTNAMIARFNTNGTADLTFTPPTSPVNGFAVAIAPDGKIFAGGSADGGNKALVRFNTNGTLDTGFSAAYPATTASSVHRIIALNDGRVLAGGLYIAANGDFYHAVRFNTDGSIDSSFALQRSVEGNQFPEAFAMERSADGKVVIAGDFYKVGSVASPNKRVVRFNDNGSIDGGWIASLEGTASANAIVRQPDGKILVGGGFKAVNGTPRGSIARLNTDGSVDSSFVVSSDESAIPAIAVQTDGKIIVGGNFGSINGTAKSGLARLNADGSVDGSFTSGVFFTSFVRKVVVQPDGKILAGGAFFLTPDFSVTAGIVRLNANGSLDSAFTPPTTSTTVFDIALESSGKIYVGGSFANIAGSGRARFARLNANGSVDTTFAGTGANSTVQTIAQQVDGKILIGGLFTTVNAVTVGRIARLNVDGTVDSSLATGTGFDGALTDIVIQPDGQTFSILVGGGFSNFNATPQSRVARLNSVGTLADFSVNINGGVNALDVQTDGKVLLGGSFTTINGQTRLAVARLAANALDSCSAQPIGLGQSISALHDANSCLDGVDKTSFYTFTGTANQQIAIAMETSQFFSKVELVNPSGAVIATVGGVNGVNNARLPASGFFTLPVAGVYTIRAIAAFGGAGSYTLSLYEAPVGGPGSCTYTLSSSRTEVGSGGGVFSFDVVTPPGCPPAAAPAAAGTFYTNASYSGGRVTFNVGPLAGTVDREEVMTVAGQPHTIKQYCTCPPTNDFVDNPNLITGANSPPNAPERGTNGNASGQNGEPAHAGNPATRSVWYVWTAPAAASGLYSFSTSGSSFDTVMAIYRCPAGLAGCNFTNFTPVGANDDTTFFDTTSKVNFRADAGATYLIAVDGKNGATGTIELSWRQYTRLYRLYLQTFNGNQSPLVPDSVSASNGTNTVTPTLVSLGVYEFNLPADNSIYNVTITGPTGIIWNPNNFPLDSSFRYLDDLMRGDGALGTQNVVSNAQFFAPRFIRGYIRNITSTELPQLGVKIGSSRGPNPREEFNCPDLAPETIASVPYIIYQCESQPNTLHDIVPNMPGKLFTVSVLTFPNPITDPFNGTIGNSFVATNAPTFNLSGNVASGGAGTQIDLTYTPTGNTQAISLRRMTDASGNFSFASLAPNTYRIRATRTGFVFPEQPPINLTADQTISISPENACGYTPGTATTIPVAGGVSQFTVTASGPSCEWAAASDVPWITISSGAIVGTGPVHFIAQPNAGAGRIGTIRIQGRADPVTVQQATTTPTFGTITGRVLTPNGSAIRNATVTLIDNENQRRTATTSSFGVYTFKNVQQGQIYTAAVTTKRYRFSARNLPFTANLSGVDFVGLE